MHYILQLINDRDTEYSEMPNEKAGVSTFPEIRHDFVLAAKNAIEYENWLHGGIEFTQCESAAGFPRDFIPVGSLEFVLEFLEYHGISPKPINVPQTLYGFVNRNIINIRRSTVRGDCFGNFFDGPNCFVKSEETFKNGQNGLRKTWNTIPSGNWQVSSEVKIDSEWRIFVLNGKILDVRCYSGDPWLLPQKSCVERMIHNYSDAPRAYTLDVGVNSGGTFVIEVHDFFSCGLYGFNQPQNLLKMLKLGIWKFTKPEIAAKMRIA